MQAAAAEANQVRRGTAPPIVENGPGLDGFGAGGGPAEDDGEDIFAGDVSSIMIKPDQILADQNIAGE